MSRGDGRHAAHKAKNTTVSSALTETVIRLALTNMSTETKRIDEQVSLSQSSSAAPKRNDG